MEIFPEVVEYDPISDTYGVQYTALIPIIIKSVKEQQRQIEFLLDNNAGADRVIQKAGGIYSENSSDDLLAVTQNGQGAALYQNAPNPFSQSTQIKYYLPETVSTASLCIYDLQGKQLKQTMLTERGEGAKIISASEFAAGIYLYALLADGKEIDVKRMILTE
jgi:hypothetical protein